ncbi:unnamed protein product, partial [Mesorhabditis spiculigera]
MFGGTWQVSTKKVTAHSAWRHRAHTQGDQAASRPAAAPFSRPSQERAAQRPKAHSPSAEIPDDIPPPEAPTIRKTLDRPLLLRSTTEHTPPPATPEDGTDIRGGS